MITAKVINPNAEWNTNREKVKKLQPNTYYEVENIDMGQSYTVITLANIEGHFNSVIFEFYEDEKLIDIFSDKRFNPYLN